MNQLSMFDTASSQPLTMSSREIAELVHSRHDKVKQSIERLAERGVIGLPPLGEYLDSLGRRATEYRIGKRDSYVIVAQLSPEFTAGLVDRWQELENAVNSPSFNVPQTYSAALRLAAEQAELIESQGKALVAAAPKVEFVDNYVNGTGLKGFRQVAKLLDANEHEFRAFLVEHKIMYRLGGEWTAYDCHISAGRFQPKTGVADQTGHVFNQAKFTPKGVTWIAAEWAKHKMAQKITAGDDQ